MKKILFIGTALVALVLTACQRDDSSIERTGAGKGFSLSYSVPNSQLVGPATRATVEASADENAINTFHILFFERKDNGEGRFIEVYDASPAVGSTLEPNGEINIQFPNGSLLDRSTPYNMLMVVNIGSYLNGQDITTWLSTFAGKTENQVIGEYKASKTNTSIVSSDIFMSARAVKDSAKDKVEVKLERGAVRVDVVNNTDTQIYDLKQVSIWNVYPSTSIWANSAPKEYDLPRSKQFAVVDDITNNSVVGKLYAFENNVASPANEDYLTTCLIIGIAKDNITTYYRANINLNSIGQSLIRNHAYKVSIQNVKGPGANTPQEAYESGKMLLDISVNGWIEAQEGNVKYDGDNLFAVPTTKIVFAPNSETRFFSIFTAGVGSLTISQSVLPSGLTATLDPAKKELTVKSEASPDTRSGWIELSFAGMRTIIYISQTGDLDEFLDLSSYTIPSFPFSAPFPMTGDDIVVRSSGPWTAKIFDDSFTFTYGQDVSTLAGANGDKFKVATRVTNALTTIKYSFVLISLNSNPEVNRVIVLSQRGTGGLSLFPVMDKIRFDANGNEINVAGDIIPSSVIYPNSGSDSAPWSAVLSGGATGQFTATPVSGNASNGLPTAVNGTPVSVIATRNLGQTVLASKLRVSLLAAPTVFKEVEITQLAHTVSLSYSALSQIPSAGGSSPEITVTSSDAWTATVVTQNSSATASVTSGVSGGKLKVDFAKSTATGLTVASATLTVTVTGTSVSQSVTINQAVLSPRLLTFQSQANIYGNMTTAYGDYFTPWITAIRSTNFANNSSAKVYTAGGFTFPAEAVVPNNTSGVYNANMGPGVDQHADIKTWLNRDPRNFLMVQSDVNQAQQQSLLTTVYGAGFTIVDDPQAGNSAKRTPAVRGATVTRQKVWDYIFVNGPFGSASTTTAFYSDGYTSGLSVYPATTVPILVSTTTHRVQVAIDPVLRLLFIGDCDLFGVTASLNENYVVGSDRWKIMNNIIAFMVNSAQYGDDFLINYR